MKSGERLGASGSDDGVICLSDDEDDEENDLGDGGNIRSASTPSASASGGAVDPPIASPPSTSSATPSRSNSRMGRGSAHPAPAIARAARTSSTHVRGGRGTSSGSILSPTTPAKGASKRPALTSAMPRTGRVASPAVNAPSTGNLPRGGGGPSTSFTTPGSAFASATTIGQTNLGSAEDGNPQGKTSYDKRTRNRHIQQFIIKPECVLVIDNLELDVQPQDVLAQLSRFDGNKEKIQSVHVPPPYSDLNRAAAYVVFLKKEFADAAATFLSNNFVVSPRGRPWVISSSTRTLDPEDFGFPTISAFKGEADAGDGDSNGGLKIITPKLEVQYKKAKRRLAVFEKHKKQIQVMYQRHAEEEKLLEQDPDANIYP